ncbi:hypothetical protein LEN26_006800 [Aphanomyces euteiches]|nr:hypothetical protein AeMF1_000064 [Aphanomyces euteiches]KAH9134468.1 hypothetical protein LEN26_006800 [Aphanomyces euteiches]KAH9197660.1 hypothetical protein AeNC1_000361 [Aphanomyces euteiches]
MSGAGRRSGYRKGVTQDVLYGEPEPADGELIVRVQSMRGSNLLEIETPEGSTGLAMLPTKYRKLIWIRRGDYLIVAGATGKSKGAVNYIVEHILYKDQIKHLKKKNVWPEAFTVDEDTVLDQQANAEQKPNTIPPSALLNSRDIVMDENHDDIDGQDDPMLFVNRNRMGGRYVEEESDDSDDE